MNKKEVYAHGKNGENLDNGSAVMQKHDSYARYLARKKGGAVLREESGRSTVSKSGGKKQSDLVCLLTVLKIVLKVFLV